MEYFSPYHSPIGLLVMKSDGRSLTDLAPASSQAGSSDLPVFQKVRSWLDAYFRNEQPDPHLLPLNPQGTTFQQAVWKQLLSVPYGETRSYGDIARAIGNSRACQAVGQAVGRNPIGIIIPCHRILGAHGQLTGYAWGLDKKKWLLRHEGVLFYDHP